MDSTAPKPIKPRWKPFPKVKDWKGGGGKVNRPIDFAALKELYLSGPDFDWAPFCRRHGFNEDINRNKWRKLHGVDFKEWKREWLAKQADIQDDEVALELLDVRKVIAFQRVKFVKDWTNRTQFLKSLLDATMHTHGEDLKHDITNAALIKAGKVSAKFMLTPPEIGDMAVTAIRLQELESRALLLMGNIDLSREAKLAEGKEKDPEASEIPDVEIQTMGGSGLSGEETMRLMVSYFDQAERVAEAKEVEAEQVTDAAADPV